MRRHCSMWTNDKSLTKYLYRSPEIGLEFNIIRYTPAYFCKLLYRKGFDILSCFSEMFYIKQKRILKKKEVEVVGNCYGKALGVYFDWVIKKSIEGHIIKLFGESLYLVRVYCYTPTEIEIKRTKELKKLVPKDLQVETVDFYNRCYRVGIFKLNNDGYYENTGYFLRLPTKYKKMLEVQVNKDTDIYATNISI